MIGKRIAMLKISTEIASAARICGEHKAVEYVAKAGFDAWDFSMFDMCKYSYKTKSCMENDHPLAGSEYLRFARELKNIGLDNGIICNQSHAPFPTHSPEVCSYLKRAIECTAEVGGEICVIHPANKKSAEENAQMYMEILPFAKSCGVKIATENMWEWDREEDHALPAACSDPASFKAHVDVVNDPFMVACLDIGHAQMRGCNTSAPEMILALGDRLQALHIHDNDCWHDNHQIPFSMNIDFDAVVDALKKIGYKGYLTLEADAYLRDFNEETVLQGLRDLVASASKLAEMMK